MKKYIIYLGILAIGILFGSLFFGGISESETDEHSHEIAQDENQLWTCSMHPQIMQPEQGDCPLCGMDLIPADVSEDGLSANEFVMSENALALANIETTRVSKNAADVSGIRLSGKIKANEKKEAIQTAHFGGRIEKLFINTTGEKVNKGQQLALIYSPALVTAQKELLTALAVKDSDPELYNAVRNKLKIWKLSESQIQKIERSESIIENFPIYANVRGIVTMKMVEEGNYIKEGQGLFMIADLSTVWADFDAYENQISSIAVGDKITIKTIANPNEEVVSKVTFIDPVLNTATRTVTIRTELSNKNNQLKPGMFINGVISSEDDVSENIMLLVPKSAVMWTGKRSLVYLKKAGDEAVFEMKEVTLGKEVGKQYEILAGLDENDEVVSHGTFTIDAAAQLQGKRSMMNRDGEKEMSEHAHSSDNNEDESQQEEIEIERIEVADRFQNQLQVVYSSYLEVKDALVNDEFKFSLNKIEDLNESLSKVDMKLLQDENAHQNWMKFYGEMEAALLKMKDVKEIKDIRYHFMALSDNLTYSIKMFGVNQKVYRQYCPMANDDKGAYWLSSEEQVLNPYFGDMMLRCGFVKETIIE